MGTLGWHHLVQIHLIQILGYYSTWNLKTNSLLWWLHSCSLLSLLPGTGLSGILFVVEGLQIGRGERVH